MSTDLRLVRDHTILSVVTGSRAYGLATGASDVDRRGVFVAPAPLYWRFDKPPTHLDGPLPEQFSWELERFCELALAANPTVLECLWSPLVERVTPIGEELLAVRTAFLSRRAHRTFLRYADSQFRKLQGDLRKGGEPNWKHVMHMLRLLDGGVAPTRLVMAWVEMPSLRVLRSDQVYAARSPLDAATGRAVVRYTSASRDFTADLTVDADGLVVDYPRLARRV